MNKLVAIFNKYSFWLVLLLLIFIPLYPKYPLLNIGGTYVAVRLEDIVIALCLGLWVIFKFKDLKKFKDTLIFKAFLLFWIIGLLSLISAYFLTYSITFKLGVLHFLRRIEYMSLFFIGATALTKSQDLKTITKAIFLTVSIVVIYGFGQIWLNFPVISTTNREFSKGLILYLTQGARVNSTFAGHYDLAVYLSMILMFISTLFLFYRKIIEKILVVFVGVISFALLGFTASRVSFIATLVGIGLIFIFSRKWLLLSGLIVGAILLVGIVPDLRHRLVATITVNLLGGGGPKYSAPQGAVNNFTDLTKYPEEQREQIRQEIEKQSTQSAQASSSADIVSGEPINTTELGVYRSFGIRTNVEWPRAMRAFYKNPFLGTGYSSVTLATDNDYLRSLAEVGLMGTLSLALIFYILIKDMISFVQKGTGFAKSWTIASLTMVITILLTATFIDVFEASKIAEIFWLMMGITWGLTHFKSSET